MSSSPDHTPRKQISNISIFLNRIDESVVPVSGTAYQQATETWIFSPQPEAELVSMSPIKPIPFHLAFGSSNFSSASSTPRLLSPLPMSPLGDDALTPSQYSQNLCHSMSQNSSLSPSHFLSQSNSSQTHVMSQNNSFSSPSPSQTSPFGYPRKLALYAHSLSFGSFSPEALNFALECEHPDLDINMLVDRGLPVHRKLKSCPASIKENLNLSSQFYSLAIH